MEVEIIKKVLMKPIGPAVGFVSQFLVMPCVSQVSILKSECILKLETYLHIHCS